MNIAVLGQGPIGLPLAMAAFETGHHVIGFEPRSRCLEQLRAGVSPVKGIPDHALQAALKSGRYRATCDEELLTGFDVAVIAVPTPQNAQVADLGAVRKAAETLARHVRRGTTVVLESTAAHPGTTRKIVRPILEALSWMRAGVGFHLGFSPARIEPGSEQWSLTNPPKIVSGLTEKCRNQVEAFYTGITQNVMPANSLEEAELAKVFEDTFRYVNNALVNELCRVAHTLDVAAGHALALSGSDPFGFATFTPGPGPDGHGLPVDPVHLIQHGAPQEKAFRLVELAQEINEAQPAYVVGRLEDGLGTRRCRDLKGARVLALGLACRTVTGSRRSPAAEVVVELERRGALVDVVDPLVTDGPHPLGAPLPYPSYDAVVLLTVHDGFDLARVTAESGYVLDTQGVMPDAPHIERL
ncbi:nucleotide sugar dehydrogenase (plasmid) [Streptomyces sp. R39]|uniref:Nucleotide sugar dehydrogenase n=1 Tax=Streptomyces sp. R39 TaxID=3238631 RepID=A0AB39R529_9ACTN